MVQVQVFADTIATMRALRKHGAGNRLFDAVMDSARRLKREHRAEYERNPRAFREGRR